MSDIPAEPGIGRQPKAWEPPAGLGKLEMKIWWETMGYLRILRTVHLVTPEELVRFCQAYAEIQRNDRKEHWKVFYRRAEVVRTFCNKCGMTPASRARLGIIVRDGPDGPRRVN